MSRILRKPSGHPYRSLWRKSLTWIVRLMSTLGMAVAAYLLLSLFFDTPIEYEIKKSTRMLEKEYEALSERYDTLGSVLDNLTERDRNVYKILFESEPYSDEQEDSRDRQLALYERLLGMTNKELGDEFLGRNGQLYQRVHNQQARIESMERYFAGHRDQINAIPSIQPVSNPGLTLLTASFGNRIHPFYKSVNHHSGVDYSVPTGTAVFATADGLVLQVATRGEASGVSVLIDHQNGYRTFYAHLDRVMATPGTRAARGDIIGFSGNSGLSYAPHLHYEVRHNGTAVDPSGYFFMELDMNQLDKIRRIARTGMQSLD